MTKPTAEQVAAWAKEAGFPPHIRAAGTGRELQSFASLAYAAGQAAERSKMPPTPLVIEMSDIDKEMLVEAMKRSNTMHPVLVSGTPLADDIAEAVAAEREACAKVCDAMADDDADDEHDPWSECAESCAAAIRARGHQ